MEYPNPEDCLASTHFIDSDSETIQACVHKLELEGLSPNERAVKIFNYVRDDVTYEFSIRVTRDQFKASYTVVNGRGYCVRKALLLGALCRAVDIPAVVILCDMRDGSLAPKIVEALGTDVMHYHGLCGIYLDGEWLKLDASLSPALVEKKQYRIVKFDGHSDALQENTTLTGGPHMEYVAYHGAYVDLPYEQMMQGYKDGFSHSNKEMMAQLGLKSSFDT